MPPGPRSIPAACARTVWELAIPCRRHREAATSRAWSKLHIPSSLAADRAETGKSTCG